jgi:hypothetical protein
MKYYTRTELVECLQIGEDVLIVLEEEEIVISDAPAHVTEDFTEVMFERARVAINLIEELEINLPGVAVIIRMREEMAAQRRVIDAFIGRLRESKE